MKTEKSIQSMKNVYKNRKKRENVTRSPTGSQWNFARASLIQTLHNAERCLKNENFLISRFSEEGKLLVDKSLR